MGKHEVGTPKYIANKIKAKGLQKLKWFCQICEKQCRDENGFKCHTMSESHHRQLLLFADNASRYMDQFSREFSQGYLNLLKRQFGTRRVPANRVYQEYIADRTHVHMNATIWLSLTAFVKWLGRTGQCVVDETEKGWFVTYIDRDPETLLALEKKAKKQKMDKDDEERTMEFIEKQVERGRQEMDEQSNYKVPLVRPEDDAPLILEMKLKPKALPVPKLDTIFSSKLNPSNKRKRSDEIKIENDDSYDKFDIPCKSSCNSKKEKRDNKSKSRSVSKEPMDVKLKDTPATIGWLRSGLVVKVVTKSLGEKYYRAKGVIQDTIDDFKFLGKIKLTTPEVVEGHVLKIDQEHLETVIPAIGKEVLILKGKYAGCTAIVQKVRVEEYSIDVELKTGDIVKRLPYEDVCKYVHR
ncbi:DNA/RNA-binding protein KIN17 [Orussus abietinus]|uniref:DNA/RNA-binding protein KIN17 n=1 Tax=Orussus abietinus TaxID=222816 RepID=UPI000625CCA3|nr:DNA/RNA-binding protein KIN17 [Orussus abietinus]